MLDKIEALIDRPDGPKGHWIWTGTLRRGVPIYGKNNIPVRRHAYRCKYGPLDVREQTWVTCGQPRCVNPDHVKINGGGGPGMRKIPVIERLLARVRITGTCWMVSHRTISRDGVTTTAKLVAYNHWVGEVPDGHELHLSCKHGLCVNPDHIYPMLGDKPPYEPDSLDEDAKVCPRGHPLTGANAPGPLKLCRQCRAEERAFEDEDYEPIEVDRRAQLRRQFLAKRKETTGT